MKSGWIFFLSILILSACQQKKTASKPIDLEAEREALMETDRDFSKMSVTKGMKEAFLEYIDSNGVLLRPNKVPIVGAQAIDYLIQINDTSYKFNWEPQHAVVAKSADLGYTYGLYAIHPSEADTVIYGTYVSIWKKQGDGSWKFVLDTGNEGLGEDEN